VEAAEEEGVVRAAGGLVVRDGEVLLVHRPKYDDWTFPKGKAEPGESDEDCARREVLEETGLTCELEEELPQSRYTDAKGRPKRVRWWRMRRVSGEFAPTDEIDEVLWVPVEEAEPLLSYARDAELLDALGSEPARDEA
jgi:8-oxo-dGTP pyrophosphatase MutT (NUDIX family)